MHTISVSNSQKNLTAAVYLSFFPGIQGKESTKLHADRFYAELISDLQENSIFAKLFLTLSVKPSNLNIN